MNLLKKTFALLFLLFLGSSALADGMIVDRQSRLYMQDSQQAFINYENGVENLFIMVNLRDAIASGEENVWIFPVPAKPESIEINNLKGFPALYGTEIKQQAIENVLFLEGYMLLASFPLIGIIFLPFLVSLGGTQGQASLYEGGLELGGVTIYEHIDRYGIATEVIKASDAADFKKFLSARGTNLSADAEKFLLEYMGKDYSFIVSWISDIEAVKGAAEVDQFGGRYANPIGVFIKFPTEKIYFPLKPTAFYGNNSFPVTLNIAGFKDADVYWNIKDSSRIGHYYQKFFSRTLDEEETMKAIFNGSLPESLNYTKIQINKEARYFTEDLFFSPAESVPANALNFVNQAWLFIAILIFFGFSFLSINLADKMLGLNLNRKDMAVIAASNFFTLIVAGIVIALTDKKKFPVKEKATTAGKKLIALLAFEGIFFGFAVILFILTLTVISLTAA